MPQVPLIPWCQCTRFQAGSFRDQQLGCKLLPIAPGALPAPATRKLSLATKHFNMSARTLPPAPDGADVKEIN